MLTVALVGESSRTGGASILLQGTGPTSSDPHSRLSPQGPAERPSGRGPAGVCWRHSLPFLASGWAAPRGHRVDMGVDLTAARGVPAPWTWPRGLPGPPAVASLAQVPPTGRDRLVSSLCGQCPEDWLLGSLSPQSNAATVLAVPRAAPGCLPGHCRGPRGALSLPGHGAGPAAHGPPCCHTCRPAFTARGTACPP